MTPHTDRHSRFSEPCEEYLPLLIRAADDSLAAGDRAHLDAHLQTCDACREALDVQRTAYVNLAGAFDVDPPLGFSTRVVAHLNSDPQTAWLDRLDFRRWTWRVSPIAVGLGLVAYLMIATGESTAASESAATAIVVADPVAVSDVIDGGDLVSMVWDAENGSDTFPVSGEEAPQ
jgi:anti-sigma factor RsiW